jgi:hypothetical protein
LSETIQYARTEGGHETPALKPEIVRFGELLSDYAPDDEAIAIQEHWALLYELRGDIPGAITHRERAIAGIRRWIALGPIPPLDHAYLAESLLKLAEDHWRIGNVGRAAELQAESEAVRKQQEPTKG